MIIYFSLAALCVVAVAACAWWLFSIRRGRFRAADGETGGPYPVVLVHGFFGFDQLDVLGRQLHYFRGVSAALRADGVDVHVVRLPPLASVSERATALVSFIRGLDVERVNIVAHSMGGIDARFAITELGLADDVASLVTIGSPHRGTPLAHAGNSLPARAVRAVLETAGVSTSATEWLTPEQMERFNRTVLDQPSVYYASVVGRPSRDQIALVLKPSRRVLEHRAGTSDGVVPSASQAWGDLLFEVPADHWAQIGWSKTYDARPLYRDIIGHLRSKGL